MDTLSPPIRIRPEAHHHLKSWAAARGLQIRQAMILIIEQVCGPIPGPLPDPRQLPITGSGSCAGEKGHG
jgi:hypothetical protein